jgi:hypothetical protein
MHTWNSRAFEKGDIPGSYSSTSVDLVLLSTQPIKDKYNCLDVFTDRHETPVYGERSSPILAIVEVSCKLEEGRLSSVPFPSWTLTRQE